MRIADVAVVVLVFASGYSAVVNTRSSMLIFTMLGIFLAAWYAMLRLTGRIPSARDRMAARARWHGFLRRGGVEPDRLAWPRSDSAESESGGTDEKRPRTRRVI